MTSRIPAPNDNSLKKTFGSVYEQTKTLARHCLNCSKIFWIRPDFLKHGLGNYCSRKCSSVGNRKKSEEHKAKISRTIKVKHICEGKNNPNYRGGLIQHICEGCGTIFTDSRTRIRRFCSIGCRAIHQAEYTKYYYGPDHPNWIDGIGKKSAEKKRSHTKYKEWRKSVFERDGYKCVVCHEDKSRLNVHHILEWAKYPERRYDTENGMTVCTLHHQVLHPDIVLTDTRKYFLKNELSGEL